MADEPIQRLVPLPRLLRSTFPDLFFEERWKLWNGRLLPYWFFGVAFLAAIAVGFVARWIVRHRSSRYRCRSRSRPSIRESLTVMPAFAGIHDLDVEFYDPRKSWIPGSAGHDD